MKSLVGSCCLLFFPLLLASFQAQDTGAPPPNVPAGVVLTPGRALTETDLVITYERQAILRARVLVVRGPESKTRIPFTVPGEKDPPRAGHADRAGPRLRLKQAVQSGPRGEIEQVITLRLDQPGEDLRVELDGTCVGSDEAIPVETGPRDHHGVSVPRLKIVRNVVGISRNLRNHAVYDRARDWLLVGPGPFTTRIEPLANETSQRRFRVTAGYGTLRLVFRPHFFQKHKNLAFFRPWTYRVWRGSVTGWCSWWPYRADFCEKNLEQVLKVFQQKRLGDYGYRTIQIDDTFQRTPAGPPDSWLHWNDKFPGGMAGYVKQVREAGFEPGIWIGAMFHDRAFVNAHPGWFIPGSEGKPLQAPWLGYGVDPTVPAVLEQVVRPIFQGLRQAGFTYVKVDTLRHLLYDAMYHARPHFEKAGVTVEDAFRRYVQVVRDSLGPDVYLLACWGVLPEVVGLASGCRLGTDGFGPAKLQQFNSWNGIVWRNDPDHCDVLPVNGGDQRDTVLRPVIVSLAGAMLMLSDRAEVYRNNRNLEGLKRAAPVLFTVPGQIHDVDPVTSDNVILGLRPDQGGGVGPIDARHQRPICPWWMLEINRPFGSWTVLGRFNFAADRKLAAEKIAFHDLGLDPRAPYLVYEFWTGTFLGSCQTAFEAMAQAEKSVRVYVLRRQLDRPQFLSTTRHISQGGVDLVQLHWDPDARTLSGTSRVVAGDGHVLTFHVPKGFTFTRATYAGREAKHMLVGGLLRLIHVPERSGTVDWTVRFQ